MSNEKVEQAPAIPFGVDKEFEESKFVPPAATSPAIVQEVDFGDGPVKIEASNHKELIDKILAEKDRYIEQKLMEPQQQQYLPEMPQPFQPLEPPTNDELAVLLQSWNTDPVGVTGKLVEYSLGMSLDEARDKLAAADYVQSAIYGDAVGNDFVARHEADYFPCPENAKKMADYMEKNGLDPIPQNFDYAFSKLNAVHAFKAFPKDYFEEGAGNEPATSSASTALSGSQSSYPVAKELNADEIVKQSWNMPLDEYEAMLKSRPRR